LIMQKNIKKIIIILFFLHPFNSLKILTEMPNIDHKLQDAKGNMALHEAAIQGDCNIFNILFSVLSMKDINCENFEGETPLFLAAAHGHLKATELLLDYGNLMMTNYVHNNSQT
jgi:ankyrin repeat protein